MAETATDLTKEQLNKLNKEWLSKGYMLNPDWHFIACIIR
jgi:hypothetical protein